MRVVTELLSLLFLLVVAVAGLQVLPAQRDQDTLTLGVTIFWFYLALPVSALLMMLVIVARLLGFDGAARERAARRGAVTAMLIVLLVVVFALTMTLGVPIAFCLGLGGLAFIVLSGTVPIAVLPTLMFGGMDSFPLLAIPFFIIAGDLMQRSGVLPKLIDFANSLVGHLRGGLAYVVVLTSMLFAGVTGRGARRVRGHRRRCWPRAWCARAIPAGSRRRSIAGSAVMGPIIPPSVAMLDLRLRLRRRDLGRQAVPHGRGARRAGRAFPHGPGVA